MKIISALKRIKHLDRKIEKTSTNYVKWSSFLLPAGENSNTYNPYSIYDLKKMKQQIRDWTIEKVKIRKALHLTNINTLVTYKGKEYSIDHLLLVKCILIPNQLKLLKSLRRAEKQHYDNKEDRVITLFSYKERDMEVDALEIELSKLDEIIDNLSLSANVIGL